MVNGMGMMKTDENIEHGHGHDGRGGEGDDGAVKVVLLGCGPRQEGQDGGGE